MFFQPPPLAGAPNGSMNLASIGTRLHPGGGVPRDPADAPCAARRLGASYYVYEILSASHLEIYFQIHISKP